MTALKVAAACCDYCGLPLSRSFADRGEEDAAQYCCFGCRFAALMTAEKGEEGQARWMMVRLGLAIFFAMNVMVFSMALWTQDVYGASTDPTAAVLWGLFRWSSLLFATPVLLLLGGPLLENTFDGIRRGIISSDLLLVVGIVAAFIMSLRSVIGGEGQVYFEVVCVVLVAVTLGRWLEATGRMRTTQALRSLENLLPKKARQVRPATAPQLTCSLLGAAPPRGEDFELAAELSHSANESMTPLDELLPGDLIRVLPGERIPVDGVLVRNPAAIDEQMVTGESQPAIKEPGDDVLAGSLNLDGDLLIRVSNRAAEGTLQRLIDAVCQAALSRSQLQKTADRVAAVFLPLVILVALVTFVAHFYFHGFEQGILTGLAVLLIACPCALGIATPMAIWAAMGRAARSGVVFRNGDAIQRLAQVNMVCFDKTGTLTSGETMVSEFVVDPETPQEEVVAAAMSLASGSIHGLSCAVKQYLCDLVTSDQGSTCLPILPGNLETFPGRGVRGHIPEVDQVACLGNVRWMQENDLRIGEAFQNKIYYARSAGEPLVCIGWAGHVRGLFLFREHLREEAAASLAALRDRHIHVAVLTGDHSARAATFTDALGVKVACELRPDEKAEMIQRFRKENGTVAMVGDGVNDAPALAAADIGIAMGCGADLSRDTAGVCLLGNDLRRVPWSIQLAQQTVATVRQNLFWAFAYNVVGIGIAVAGWLNPIWAAVAMVLSSLFVVSNSLRLSGSERKAEPANA